LSRATAPDLRCWFDTQDRPGLDAIGVVATDLAESYRAGLAGRLDHATRVADPFHVVHVGNRCLDKVRRRVQNETLGHRGHKNDPLYRIRKLMLAGAERLDTRGRERMLLGLRFGDPHDEVLGAWLAKESVRDLYLTDDPADAATLLDKTIAGCQADEVDEIRSLGATLANWRDEILAHHDTGASNGPTEGLARHRHMADLCRHQGLAGRSRGVRRSRSSRPGRLGRARDVGVVTNGRLASRCCWLGSRCGRRPGSRCSVSRVRHRHG
jgi:transposase